MWNLAKRNINNNSIFGISGLIQGTYSRSQSCNKMPPLWVSGQKYFFFPFTHRQIYLKKDSYVKVIKDVTDRMVYYYFVYLDSFVYACGSMHHVNKIINI